MIEGDAALIRRAGLRVRGDPAPTARAVQGRVAR